MNQHDSKTDSSACGKGRVFLDAREADAAWAILKMECVLQSMEEGRVLELWGVDPQLRADLPRVLRWRGGRLLRVDQKPGYFCFLIARSKPESPD